ncbi:MAG: PQQ-binding-like beta-propeller repeat protein, partial [Ilumatobacteraceae bacterium]
TNQVAVPSVIFASGEEILYGGPAERRGATQPLGLAREFKRRLGDPVPLMLAGSPYHADRLTALMAKWVLDTVTAQVGSAPSNVVLTHPANWTEYQLGTLRNALADVGLADAGLVSEPAAAAMDFAALATVEPESSVLVYDLGGGTFDVALLQRSGDAFEQQIEPAGIERLGGIDFDEAVFQYVVASIPAEALATARGHPEGAAAIAALRRRCVDAKEALSSDATSDVPVMLPGFTSTVRITRSEFEDMIRPMVRQTIGLVESTLARAGIDAASLGAVLIVGGSSRIPLVPQMVSEQLRLPVRVDAHPKLVVARGAARQAGLAQPARAPARPRVAREDDDDDLEYGRSPWAIVAVVLVVVLALAGAGYWFLLRDDEDSAAPDATSAPGVLDSVPGTNDTTSDDSEPASSVVLPAGEPGDVVWTVPTGAPMASVKGPALADGTAVFGSQNGKVYRVGADDGSVVWEQQVSDLVFSSPAVADDAVYVGGGDGLHALSLADGSERWKTIEGAPVRSSPVIVDGVAYVGSDDTNVYAIDAATGGVLWATPLGGEVLSSPAVSDGRVYVGSFDGSFYALDAATGAIAWTVPLGGQVWSSPVVDGTTVFVGGNDRRVHALDTATGSEVWQFVTSDVVSSSPTVQDGVVYVGSFDGRISAIDAAIGGERWRYDTDNVVFSSPKAAGDTIYVGSHSGSVYALAAADGSLQWRTRTGAIVGATPSVDDDHVYVGSDDGNMYAMQR